MAPSHTNGEPLWPRASYERLTPSSAARAGAVECARVRATAVDARRGRHASARRWDFEPGAIYPPESGIVNVSICLTGPAVQDSWGLGTVV
jgi:hypothetical protein